MHNPFGANGTILTAGHTQANFSNPKPPCTDGTSAPLRSQTLFRPSRLAR